MCLLSQLQNKTKQKNKILFELRTTTINYLALLQGKDREALFSKVETCPLPLQCILLATSGTSPIVSQTV